MKYIIWNKEDIKNITEQEKEMWFDTYNNDLFEGRGYDVMLMDIEEIDKLYIQFKKDYFDYLDSLEESDEFICYLVCQDEYGKFVSQARIMLKGERYFVEGLETHRDFMKQGLATKLIRELEHVAILRGIKEIYANSYEKNIPSIKTFQKRGFKEVKCDVKSRVCMKKNLE